MTPTPSSSIRPDSSSTDASLNGSIYSQKDLSKSTNLLNHSSNGISSPSAQQNSQSTHHTPPAAHIVPNFRSQYYFQLGLKTIAVPSATIDPLRNSRRETKTRGSLEFGKNQGNAHGNSQCFN